LETKAFILKPKTVTLILGVIASLALDQFTKLFILAHFKINQILSVIDGMFFITHAHNYGAAFGFFTNYKLPFFLAVSLIAVGFILHFFYKLEENRILLSSALAMILGGALGNLIDRIRLGYVVDFFHLYYKNFQWPTFNMADVFIVTGVGIFLIDTYRMEKAAHDKSKQNDRG